MKTRTVTCGHCGQERQVPDGAELREAREVAGVSLRQMAKWLQCSAPYLSDVERNNRNVSRRWVRLYRSALQAEQDGRQLATG